MGLERINELRRLKGYTIDDLSVKSGVPVSTIKKISAGITTNPNFDTVQALVYAMDCSLDDLDGIKKSSTPAEAEVEDVFVRAMAQRLNEALVSLGFLAEGEHLTARQGIIIKAVISILAVEFGKAKDKSENLGNVI